MNAKKCQSFLFYILMISPSKNNVYCKCPIIKMQKMPIFSSLYSHDFLAFDKKLQLKMSNCKKAKIPIFPFLYHYDFFEYKRCLL